MLKQFIRFLVLQTLLTWITISYFDFFLIGEYKDGFTIIAENLMEDRDRFYPFLNPNLVKIDVYIAFFVFIFLIVLYSSKFYSYVNELSFSLNERLLDEFISIYLLWTSSLLIFFQIFRFTTISRLYVLGLTFIIPVILLFFRNSEFMSSLLGRNPSKETVLLINIDNSSQFREMRLLKFRKVVSEVNFKDNLENRIIEYTENLFKSENINLIVINLDNVSELSSNFEKYILDLNKKILFISKNEITFKNNFIFRRSMFKDENLVYLNNDIQYGSKFIAKRFLDILLTVLLSPIIFTILIPTFLYLLIQDGRPVLHKQTRVGLHGKNFKMFKVRTMKKNAHDLRKDLKALNKKKGPLYKIDDDPRLIKGMNLIRSLSIDEIPQFFNVLKGEMSIVGPRPLFPEDNSFYDKKYIRRLNVLPGITGLLQINDRNTDDFETWFKYDLEYIENWSIYLDLKIIIYTPFSLLKKKTQGK